MKSLFAIACISIITFFTNSVYAEQGSVSDNVEIYIGDGNLTVALVRMTPLESNLALIKITGIDHELSGLVIKHGLKKQGDDRIFNTQLHGRSFNTLVESSNWRGKSMNLYLYGQRDSQYLYFDRDASKEAKPHEMLADYNKQTADGSLTKVQDFNREVEINGDNSEITIIQNDIAKACDKDIKISVDWNSVTDEMIKDISIVGYCKSAFDNVKNSCSNSDAEKAWVNSSIDSVSCEFSDKLKLKLEGKGLKFKSAVDKSNQREFVKYNLLNLM